MARLTLQLRRGDVVTVAAGGGFGSKPRPALVIQSDRYDGTTNVILALFTTVLVETELRPRFAPTEHNGLREVSDLMVDILVTTARSKVGAVCGHLSRAEMAQAQRSLFLILGFA